MSGYFSGYLLLNSIIQGPYPVLYKMKWGNTKLFKPSLEKPFLSLINSSVLNFGEKIGKLIADSPIWCKMGEHWGH